MFLFSQVIFKKDLRRLGRAPAKSALGLKARSCLSMEVSLPELRRTRGYTSFTWWEVCLNCLSCRQTKHSPFQQLSMKNRSEADLKFLIATGPKTFTVQFKGLLVKMLGFCFMVKQKVDRANLRTLKNYWKNNIIIQSKMFTTLSTIWTCVLQNININYI